MSQNNTKPAVNGVPLADTVAVNVSTVPAEAEVAGEIVNCVVVGVAAIAQGAERIAMKKRMNAEKKGTPE